MKNTKYNYLKVIQQNFGQGWEDVSEYEANSQGVTKEMHTATNGKTDRLINHDLREYRITGPTRVIFRKELKTATA